MKNVFYSPLSSFQTLAFTFSFILFALLFSPINLFANAKTASLHGDPSAIFHPTKEKCYRIVNAENNTVLDASESYAFVSGFTGDGSANQIWKFETAGGDKFYMFPLWAAEMSKAISFTEGNSADGTKADLEAKATEMHQQFVLSDAGDGFVNIKATHCNKNLALDAQKFMVLAQANDENLNQKWRIEEVNCIAVPPAAAFSQTFSATRLEDNSMELSWMAENAQAGTAFVIERSQNGLDFEFINTLAVTEDAEMLIFAEIDANAPKTSVIYRVQFIEKDGNNTYSKMVKVTAAKGVIETPVTTPETTEKRK